MPRGASPVREHEYKKLKSKFKKEHRYPGREEEVAARIVNKQRAEYGETKEEVVKDKQGKSPDSHLPIKDYDRQTIAEIDNKLQLLSLADVKKIRAYEMQHKHRTGLMAKLNRRLAH